MPTRWDGVPLQNVAVATLVNCVLNSEAARHHRTSASISMPQQRDIHRLCLSHNATDLGSNPRCRCLVISESCNSDELVFCSRGITHMHATQPMVSNILRRQEIPPVKFGLSTTVKKEFQVTDNVMKLIKILPKVCKAVSKVNKWLL